MVLGLKITKSATYSFFIFPRFDRPKIEAGRLVIFRIASTKEITFSFRTYNPRTRGKVPKEEAEMMMNKLISAGLLDEESEVKWEGDFVSFPLKEGLIIDKN